MSAITDWISAAAAIGGGIWAIWERRKRNLVEAQLKLFNYRANNPALTLVRVGIPTIPIPPNEVSTNFNFLYDSPPISPQPITLHPGQAIHDLNRVAHMAPVAVVVANQGRGAREVAIVHPHGVSIDAELGVLEPAHTYVVNYSLDKTKFGEKMDVVISFINESGQRIRQIYRMRIGHAEWRPLDLGEDSDGWLIEPS